MIGLASLPLLAVLLAAGAPARAQSTVFTANEVRAAEMKDHLRRVRDTLKADTSAGKRLAAMTSAAFRGSDDWAKETEAYYALRAPLVSRAAALEEQLNARMAANNTDDADSVRKATEELVKKIEVLRSDHEFYTRLPELAAGPDGKVAQAAMRLLAQTGDYPVALAYFLNRSRDRSPFAPMSPARTSGRLPYQ